MTTGRIPTDEIANRASLIVQPNGSARFLFGQSSGSAVFLKRKAVNKWARQIAGILAVPLIVTVSPLFDPTGEKIDELPVGAPPISGD